MSSELKYGCNNLSKSELLYLIIGLVVTILTGYMIYKDYSGQNGQVPMMNYIINGVILLAGLVLLVWSAMCLYNPEKKSSAGWRTSSRLEK